jgi:hypothetical protein
VELPCVEEIDLVKVDPVEDLRDPPGLKSGTQEEMHLVSIVEESPHEIGPDKAGSARDEGFFREVGLKFHP